MYPRIRRPAVAALIFLAGLCACLAARAEGATAVEYNAQGIEHYEAKRWDDAIQAFLQAHALVPDNTTVRRNLCNAYQASANDFAKVGDYANACRLLSEFAIPIDPENPSPLIQLGAYYLRVSYVAEAMYRLQEALDLDPENVDAHDLLGDAYYAVNDLASALTQWQWVAQRDPNRRGLSDKLSKANRENGVEYNFAKSGTRHFDISFTRGTPGHDLGQVRTILDRAYRDIGQQFGGVYPRDPVPVIIYTAEQFSNATLLGEHVGAVYDGKIRVPLRDKSGAAIPPEELERRLYHEYVHVIVRYLVGDNVPWWLNEGLAQAYSEKLTDADMLTLRRARDNGQLFSLANLEDSQLAKLPPGVLHIAYRQAFATVQFLLDSFGRRNMLNMLTALSQSMPPEEALRRNFRRTYALLDKEIAYSFGRESAP